MGLIHVNQSKFRVRAEQFWSSPIEDVGTFQRPLAMVSPQRPAIAYAALTERVSIDVSS